jgi:hypothetical protein
VSGFEKWADTFRRSSDLEKRCAAAEKLIRSGDARSAAVLKEVFDWGYPNPPGLELIAATLRTIKAIAEDSGRTDLQRDAENVI